MPLQRRSTTDWTRCPIYTVISLVTDHHVESIDTDELESWVNAKSFILERIRAQYNTGFWFKQPAILYLYYAVKKRQRATKKVWPFSEDDLRPIYTDLGLPFD